MAISFPMAISMNLFISFFFFITTFCNSMSLFSSAAQISYADHCASIVPESTENINAGSGFVHLIHTGYYYLGGGSDILNVHSPDSQVKNSIGFQCWDIRETNVQGLFKVEGTLEFQVTSRHEQQSLPVQTFPGSVSFRLNGFWSGTSGKLCMVGLSSFSSDQGYPLVLKLYNLINSTSIESLISGTLENVMVPGNDPKYLGPISILLFPRLNYKYTLASTNSNNNCSHGSEDTPASSLQVERFCSLLSSVVLNHDFQLKYSSHCVNCIPNNMSDRPQAVSLKDIACSEDKQRVRVLVEFVDRWPNWHPRLFNPRTSLVAEGSWDAGKNQLCFIACQILNAANSLNNTNVGDCSTRLCIRFPATMTIGSTSSIVGHIWSTKTVTELGYFEKITFAIRECDSQQCLLPGQTYEYTKMEIVKKLCSRKKTVNHKASFYPNPHLHAMSFFMHANNSGGQVGSGHCAPLSVDNLFLFYSTDDSIVSNQQNSVTGLSDGHNHSSSYNISYKIFIQLQSNPNMGKESVRYEMHISAEGIYDYTEGRVCMVGCQKLDSNSQQPTNNSVDCEILVNFQFPATNANGLRYIKGSIESTRMKSDPLHFEHLDLSTAANNDQERQSIWRMDGKITLVLISTTLASVFAALQLFHVKRNPEVIQSISILMLLILTLQYILPLGINFRAMFKRNVNSHNVYLGGGGWLEFNEIIVTATTFLAFLVQLQLLQVTWSAKSGNGTRKDLLFMEKKATFVSLLMYAAGALAALFLHRKNLGKRDNGIMLHSVKYSILEALISYGGLVVDGFLFPQVLLNMVYKSRKNSLSVWFYFGTTLVQALPYAYDLHRADSSVPYLDKYSHTDQSPAADFHSTVWSAITPFGGLLFAGIIYLQQRFGGHCISPGKLQELGIYDKVPADHEE